MDIRKKLASELQNDPANATIKQPDFIEGWQGSLPTKPWPVSHFSSEKKKNEEKPIEWFYNASRDQYYFFEKPDHKKPLQKKKHSDIPEPIVELYDNSDEEEVIPCQSLTMEQPLKNPINSSVSKRK